MAWVIGTIYASKCVQMDPQQLLITSEFYSICNKCDLLKIVGGDIGSLKGFIKSAEL